MRNPVRPSSTPMPQSDSSTPVLADNPSLRPLLVFAAVALPIGWVLLSVPVALDLPQEPFVLPTLLFGLLAPAIVLTYRESGRPAVRSLVRDALRPPRPLWWAPLAALAVPGVAWTSASLLGGAQRLTPDLLALFAVDLVAGLLIINMWEELAWTGFVQRRAMARWGLVGGSIATAAGFAGIHLPLAFDDASAVGDVGLGIAVLIGTGVGLRLLIACLDPWSGRSILAVGILHASFNATADLVDESHDWVRLVVTIVLGLIAIAMGRSR